MKRDYLKKLEAELIYNKIKNKDEILDKIEKRYDFGIEAGLSEEKVEEMLGSVEEIVEEFKNEESGSDDFVDLTDKYKIEVSTLSDAIEFVKSNDDKVHVELVGVDESHYNIKKSDSSLEIKYKKTKFFSLNRKKNAVIKIEIPTNASFSEVILATTSGDIKFDFIKSDVFKVNVVSADIKLCDIDCNNFYLHTVSGDINIETLTTKEIDISTVSGDVKFEFAVAESAIIDSVSGDVIITDGKVGNIKSTSVSGDIIINGEEKCTNVKNYVKGMFRK